jgi:hypothetical protein
VENEKTYCEVSGIELPRRNLTELEKKMLTACEGSLTAFYLRDHVETGLLIKFLKEVIAEAKRHES